MTSDTIDFQAALTPTLSAISPRFGSVLGGTEVTITGEGFGTDVALVSVKFDDRVCTVSAVIATEIV